jgi:hypothetical protein
MRQPPKPQRSFSPSEKNQILIVGFFLAILLVLIGYLVGLLLQRGGFQFSPPARGAETAVMPTMAIPPMVIATPDCGAPTLTIGATTYQIQMFDPAPGGSLTVPPDSFGVAYWVRGTDTNRVFVLGPTAENLALLSSLSAGGEVTVKSANCDSSIHALAAPEPGFFDAASLPDQSVEGLSIFFQTDASGNGYVASGDLTGEEINVFNLPPASGGTEVQAEISLLNTIPSSDGSTLQVEVSILNYGGTAFTVTANDVTLALEASVAFQPLESNPLLPREVQPGATETFTFTFPRPPTPTATLRVFTVEYELEGY